MYLMGIPILSAPFLKFICGLISLTIELFIFCYGFNHIENAVKQLSFFLTNNDDAYINHFNFVLPTEIYTEFWIVQ